MSSLSGAPSVELLGELLTGLRASAEEPTIPSATDHHRPNPLVFSPTRRYLPHHLRLQLLRIRGEETARPTQSW
ncbi:hypothetical protein DER29_2670 [Micromonospora sp. M71_S20]|nr:hypothetical protein DER29_2670 [Micromonospora sp. M71_S20]